MLRHFGLILSLLVTVVILAGCAGTLAPRTVPEPATTNQETRLPAPAPASQTTSAPAPTPATPAPTPAPIPTPAASTSAPAPLLTTPAMPRGTPDPSLEVAIYQPEKVWTGTTILADNHDPQKPRIIEVNMLGEIVWQYSVPSELRDYTNPGFDVEPLPNGNILFVLPRYGVFEIDRKGNAVWSYRDSKVSHDADRLPNGNTLVVFGAFDQLNDAQIKEVNPQGQIVWSWYARDHFYSAPYKDIIQEGWTHTNAASRLSNGNTLISLRNFNFIVEVDAKGTLVRKIGEGLLRAQHDPEVLPNGNILMADHNEPQRAIELDAKTGQVVWEFVMPRQLVRDANRLPNGNTLITGSTAIIEVTPDKKVIWQLRLKGITLEQTEAPSRGFYKAERISYAPTTPTPTPSATPVAPGPSSTPSQKPAIVGTVSFQVDIPQVASAAQLSMGSIIGPSLIRLKDGRFRLYLQARNQSGVNIISLISANGSRWDLEPGIRIQHGGQSDVDFEAGEPFVYLGLDGKYYMAYTGRQTVSGSNNLRHKLVFAVSDDGLAWTKLDRYYADPKNRNDFASSADVTILNGRYVMYYTGGLNVIRATSSDGFNWTRQDVILPAGHDSTMIHYNGVYYMFVKVPHALTYPTGPLEMETDDLIMAVSSDGENWSPNLYRVSVRMTDGSEVANTDLQDPAAVLSLDGSLRIFLNSNLGLRIYSIKPSGPLPNP